MSVLLWVLMAVLAMSVVVLLVLFVNERQRRLFAEREGARFVAELAVKTGELRALEQNQQSAREVAVEQRSLALEQLVVPLQQSLLKMDERLDQVERSRIAMSATLAEQVRQLSFAQEALRQETTVLSRALRQPGARGRWGELQLKRVAELAGMLEYCDFEQQVALQQKTESLQRPDMIVRLPQGRRIAVDAKVPLSAFLQAESASDEAVRAEQLREHAKSVRQHVVSLSRRAYFEQLQPAPELVVLFLPGEHFYSAALQADPTLLEHAAGERVVIATPTTLIALLKAISFGWQQEKIAENARHLSDLGRELTKRLTDALAHSLTLGRLLTRAVDGYNRMVGSFDARVLPAARRLSEASGAGAGPEALPLIDAPLKRADNEDEAMELPLMRPRTARGE